MAMHKEQQTDTTTTDETETLRAELEHYRTQKETIRDVIGQVGGQSGRGRRTAINVIFLALVLAAFAFEAMRLAFGWDMPYLPPMLALEVAVLLVSLKIIWMMHTQSRVDHFQFWVLNSIEFQINMLSRRINALTDHLSNTGSGPGQDNSDG